MRHYFIPRTPHDSLLIAGAHTFSGMLLATHHTGSLKVTIILPRFYYQLQLVNHHPEIFPLPPFPHWWKVLYAGAFQNILGLAGTHCALSLNLLTLHISYSQSHVATWFHYLWEELSPGLAHRGPGGSTVGRDIRLMSHRILSLGCHWSPLAEDPL